MAIMVITGIIANTTIMGAGIATSTAIIGKDTDIRAINTDKDTDTDIILDTSMDIHMTYMVINVLIMLTEVIINTIMKATRVDSAKATMMGTKAMIKIPNVLTNTVKNHMEAQQGVMRILKAFSVAMKMDLGRVIAPVKNNYDKYITHSIN